MQAKVIEQFGMHRVCLHWIPRLLKPEPKLYRMTVCNKLKERYETEVYKFFFFKIILTAAELYLYEYKRINKKQSSEYNHPFVLNPMKAKVGKVRGQANDNRVL